MKKILFAAVAAMAITGCSQNEEIEKAAQPVEIGFNTAVGKATKATPMLNDNFKDFKVYAYNSGSNLIKDVTKLSTTVFMNGIKTEKGEEGLWATEGTYYWPLTDKLQFLLILLLNPKRYLLGQPKGNIQALVIPSTLWLLKRICL